ncbi:MAG: GTP cyclohydrolase II [Burkholderiales bacterium]|nr:MAG: GTP cyclohydrolase II [Burkholderiales bacterium]
MHKQATALNGDMALLSVQRAIAELRHGHAICVRDAPDSGFVCADIDTLRPGLFAALGRGRRLLLVITHQRARALGLAEGSAGPLAFELPPDLSLEQLQDIAATEPLRAMTAAAAAAASGHPRARFVPVNCPRAAAAAVAIAKAGRLLPALIGCERSVREDPFAADPSVLVVDATHALGYADAVGREIERVSEARVPLESEDDCRLVLFRAAHGDEEHVAVLVGTPEAGAPVPVRLHSACLTGDLLGSLRCDCGEQLRTAVERIAGLGGGVLLYLSQEGRGIGLANKLRAYALQDTGLDTLDADRYLGFRADERRYQAAAAILKALGLTHIRLLTNSPHKLAALRDEGIDVVERLPLLGTVNPHNERYLRTKRERAGHMIDEQADLVEEEKLDEPAPSPQRAASA